MKFNSQICTSRSQSELLLALGLKKETADMAHLAFDEYSGLVIRPYVWQPTTGVDMENFIPAWSLHRLIEIYDKTCIFWADCFDNPYEAMISRIANKIKWGELNKEYLEEK